MDGLMAIFDYKNKAVRKLIETVKFGFNRELVGIVLSGWKKPKNWNKKVVLVPVPLHRYRKNWRGFNQAEIIARAVGGKKTQVVEALLRVRATAQQANIRKRKERSENIKRCFRIRGEIGSRLRNKRVILVDDVFTSGATMRECTKMLKKTGAKQVWGLVLAR
jgi:ComF family protein